MQVGLKRGAPARARASFLCVPLFEGESLKNGWIGELDAASGGVIAALARAGDFTGRLGTQSLLYNPEASGPKRIHLIGAGNPDQLDLERIRQTASRAVKRAAELNIQDVTILFPTRTSLPARDVAVALTEGCMLGEYKFDRYVTSRDTAARRIDEVTLLLATDVDAGEVQKGIERGAILADSVCRVRDMVNAPANEL